jgi:predicted nucleotidyltransferase
MDVAKAVKARREEIFRLAEKHGARNIRLFGSLARGETGPASDVDLLVDMTPGRTFLDLVVFWQDVEELLGCRVDVIAEGGISPCLRDRIHAEATPL